MSVVGTVESLWRYPVKSMRGEELSEVFVGSGGVRGDRLFAFRSSAAREEFPYFTAREKRPMLLYRPRQRENGAPNESSLEVETPAGETLRIDDPRLAEELRSGCDPQHQLSLMRSDHALADAYPISLISLQTVRTLAAESGLPPEKRRFRANIYLDLPSGGSTPENELVGRSVRIGAEVVVWIAKRDSRCMMITLDPDTSEKAPVLLKQVAQGHGGTAGVYGNVVTEGVIRRGDAVELLD